MLPKTEREQISLAFCHQNCQICIFAKNDSIVFLFIFHFLGAKNSILAEMKTQMHSTNEIELHLTRHYNDRFVWLSAVFRLGTKCCCFMDIGYFCKCCSVLFLLIFRQKGSSHFILVLIFNINKFLISLYLRS